MALSFFDDKTRVPKQEEIVKVLGKAWPLWQRLQESLSRGEAVFADLIFGGDIYGWNLWVRREGISLAALYPQDEALIAQLVLTHQQVAVGLSLPLGQATIRTMQETPANPDGSSLFFKIKTQADASDFEQLYRLKLSM